MSQTLRNIQKSRQGVQSNVVPFPAMLEQFKGEIARALPKHLSPDRMVRIAETAYRAGESTILELLDAYKGALEAETTALDLESKARDARIELDQLTGSHPE